MNNRKLIFILLLICVVGCILYAGLSQYYSTHVGYSKNKCDSYLEELNKPNPSINAVSNYNECDLKQINQGLDKYQRLSEQLRLVGMSFFVGVILFSVLFFKGWQKSGDKNMRRLLK